MSAFTPLNVEPEIDVVEEIDDSKEIQVEEALKLYQTALKLHVQGPAFYDEAEEAYDALFASEIFKYPESQSEAKRLAQINELDDSDIEDADDVDGLPAPASIEAPNTLPQLLYLSYKNHGQFLIDRVAHHIALEKERNPNFIFEHDKDAREATREPLDFFVEALDRDESDSNLWRRTARLCRLLGSRRLLRYCTEAALLSDSIDGRVGVYEPSIESLFAQAELGAVVEDVEDDLSKASLRSLLQNVRQISKSRTKIMDPFPKLPEPTIDPEPWISMEAKKVVLNVSERSWAALGKSILIRRRQDLVAGAKLPVGSDYELVIPDKRRGTIDNEELKSPQKLVTAENFAKPLRSPEKGKEQDAPTTAELSATTDSKTEEEVVLVEAGKEQETADTAPNQTTEEPTVSPIEEKPENTSKSRRESEAPPLLKRNSESAGLGDNEPSRSRSKRLRARQDTTVAIEEDIDPEEQKKQFEKQLQPFISGDKWLFQVVQNICTKVNVPNMGIFDEFQKVFIPKTKLADQDSNIAMRTALMDMREMLATWDLNKSNLVLHGRGSGASVTLIGTKDDSGLASFLEHSKPSTKVETEQTVLSDQDLADFVVEINSDWADGNQIALRYIESLLKPASSADTGDAGLDGKYVTHVWPIMLKETLCDLIVEEDENLFPVLQNLVFECGCRIIESSAAAETALLDQLALMQFVQALFELHLDIYGKITNASSKVDQPTRTSQRDRTKRWAGLASQAVSRHVSVDDDNVQSRTLAYRYLWAMVMYVSLVDPTSRDHVLLCLRDLKRTLQDAGEPSYALPNNSVMPEISVEAVDREITRLTTMDFFLSIFDPNTEDPLVTIESLEPILMEAASIRNKADENEEPQEDDPALQTPGSNEKADASPGPSPIVPRSQKLAEFLSKASASLRLSLWHRLRAAYEEIEYPPMILLCNMKSMEIILAEVKGSRYAKEAKEDRSANLLVWIRNISDILTSSLDTIRREKISLDCMDEEHLPAALAIMIDATKLLHTFAIWEDSIRVGQFSAPNQVSGAANAYKSAMNHLRELHSKCWTMLYYLLKEVSQQNTDLFVDAKGEVAEYLAAVHSAFSWREYCRVGKKAFLKMMKTELIDLNPPGDWSLDLAQVVYDLYGLKIYSKSTSVLEHGCSPDQIDRTSAIELIEPFMAQARAINIRDVLRSEMRTAAEKMQAVIGTPRSGSAASSSSHQGFNRRLLLAYLKSSINPLDLYRSLKGIGALEVMPVVTEYGNIARKKWYFLQGHLLLAKYQAQKRNAPGDDDDLDAAINYFKLDLDFDAESWETWYRLAQTYDAKVDEAITWDSKDINDPKSELVSFQKCAIHCYAMAVAVAVRHADDSQNTLNKISELYSDFGVRIYASSRAPLSMKAFNLEDYERFYNSDVRGTYKQEPFTTMKESAAWRLASVLFNRALRIRSDSWVNWYMLGKSQWKLFKCGDPGKTNTSDFLHSFVQAVEYVPTKRDNKHPDKDPVLEPHYKLVSIAYKLLKIGRLTQDEAAELLQNSLHARKVKSTEFDDPKEYILAVLKVLRSVDKSNWHHRMVARVARIYYDNDPKNPENAELARRELSQQIFTKTMTIQVWRPEYERPGRHFVYKTNYTHFFVQLLGQLNDRANVDLLAKRLRKKQNDFIAHADLWTEVVTVYLRLLRAAGQIPENHADAVFKSNLSFENFVLNAGRLEAWAHSDLSQGNASLDLLRETVELKKLNGVYIKPGIIDEVVEDVYAVIYEVNVPSLAAKADEAENRDKMRIDRMLMNDTPEPTPEPSAAVEGTTASGRPKTIGRGEIRRRAEALVAKLITPSQGRRGKREPQSPKLSRAGLAPTLGKDDASARDDSVAPSLQDDADDESELSEPPADDEEECGEGDSSMLGGQEAAASETVGDTPKTKLGSKFPGLGGKGHKVDENTMEDIEDEASGSENDAEAEGTPSKKVMEEHAEEEDDKNDEDDDIQMVEAQDNDKEEETKPKQQPVSSSFASVSKA